MTRVLRAADDVTRDGRRTAVQRVGPPTERWFVLGDGVNVATGCPICFWEDDLVQLRSPDFAGGANRPSLIEAQAAFAEIGAIDPRLVPTSGRLVTTTPATLSGVRSTRPATKSSNTCRVSTTG